MLRCSVLGGKPAAVADLAHSSLLVAVGVLLDSDRAVLIVARKQAVNQVLGFLVMENGIYTFGVGVVKESPLLVELGVLLDVLWRCS